MSKLSYTWYPKDWLYSDNVFELKLNERGLYRELIDMAMLNDNKVEFKPESWARKLNSTFEEVNSIIKTLKQQNLVIVEDGVVKVPSCEARLNLVRGGRLGGKASTKKQAFVKPTPKPLLSLPLSKEKDKRKETKEEGFLNWFNKQKLIHCGKEGKFRSLNLNDSKNFKKLSDTYTPKDFLTAFKSLKNSKWAQDSNMITPAHFLRHENFVKYLNSDSGENKDFKELLKG